MRHIATDIVASGASWHKHRWRSGFMRMIPCVSDTRFGKEPAFMEGSAPCSAARDDRPSRPKNLDKDSYRSYRLSDPKQYSAPIPDSQTVAMHRKVTQTLCADLNKLLHFLRNVNPHTYTHKPETPLTSAHPLYHPAPLSASVS